MFLSSFQTAHCAIFQTGLPDLLNISKIHRNNTRTSYAQNDAQFTWKPIAPMETKSAKKCDSEF